MKIIHQNGYTEAELRAFRPLIWKNLMECVQTIIESLEKFNLEPIKPNNKVCSLEHIRRILLTNIQANRQRLMEYTIPDEGDLYFDPVVAQQALDLWTNDIIPALIEHSSEFYFMDSAS